MIPHFRRSVKMEGQWYRISWKKGQKKTSMNSARHINFIDFFDVKIIDSEKDSLRFYYLGKKYENKIEHFGCRQTYLPEEPMIL